MPRRRRRELETARAWLEASDTTAAARELGRIAREERLTPRALTSIFLLGWIARGATDDPAVRQWDKLRERPSSPGGTSGAGACCWAVGWFFVRG